MNYAWVNACSPNSQDVPVVPIGHAHSYPMCLSMHLPPFTHGLLAHSLTAEVRQTRLELYHFYPTIVIDVDDICILRLHSTSSNDYNCRNVPNNKSRKQTISFSSPPLCPI